ncbi:cytochrome P450 3A6-like isoform X2 [Pomacea canaliculata]|uniref:cytochrome P450 3A6-like isoform X2 n=1 Tax=Pomacea canaliculata TaxID=400727 RepID=UPI000D72DD61|nr:cytochrome P450 3A6-like isoform X2 [Pomacea canaliculata]
MEITCAMDWLLPASLFLLVVLLVYMYGTWTFSTFTRCDIPGPTPVPFLGNLIEIRKKNIFNALVDWSRQYGKTFGCFFMRAPLLLTTDLDIVKEVFVKDFSNFTDHGNVIARPTLYPASVSVAGAKGDTWRRLRHIMTPTFSTGKLKLMNPSVNRCCDSLSQALQRHTEKRQLVDVKRVFGAYTADVIAGTEFSLETDFQTNENDVFMQAAISLMRKATSMTLLSLIITLFPCIERPLRFFQISDAREDAKIVIRVINNLIEERKQSGQNEHVDLLQLLLDSEASEADIAAKPQDRQMTKDEIIAQCITIFLAGYETTAATLQYMIYLLAVNPDKQEKLYDEIITTIGDDTATYENVMSLKYLDNTLKETLRCFPPIPFVTRIAAETRTIKDVTIRAGTSVGVSICSIMQDDQIFPEPSKFLPERFDNEDMPTLIRELAFGMGPRQCIGMRLALYEAKMAAVTIVRRFKFIKVPETPEMITFSTSARFSSPDKLIFVGTELRNSQ